MWKKISILVVVSTTISGCVPYIICGEGYQQKPSICRANTRIEIPDAEVDYKLPQQVRVVVLPSEVNVAMPEFNSLAQQIESTTEQVVLGLGGSVVKGEERLLQQLKSDGVEIKRGNRIDLEIADYAVWTELNKISFYSELTERNRHLNENEDQQETAAYCQFGVEVEGIINTYDLSNLNIVNKIKFSSSDLLEEEFNGGLCELTTLKGEHLITSAVKMGIKYNYDLKQELAASGKVLEVRQCDDLGSIVRVSIGEKHYVKPEMEVRFETVSKIIFNNEVEYEIYEVGKGIVLPKEYRGVRRTYSWVHVSESLAERLKRGDIVTLYPTSVCDNMMEPLREMCFNAIERLN